LVDDPRGRVDIPATHDLEWVYAESESLARELRANHLKRWAKPVEVGLRKAKAGSLEYLGHALEILQYSGPTRRNRARIEDLIVTIGRLW
jgi:hypothetical protein